MSEEKDLTVDELQEDELTLEELEEKAKVETLAELKKRKAVETGKEKAVEKVTQDQKNEAKKLRIEQLLGMGRAELVSYAQKLGFKNIQWKVIEPEVKRDTKDIAHLVYYKELEVGGKEKAADLVMFEANRQAALIDQKKRQGEQKQKAENAEIRYLRSEIELLKEEISKLKK